MAVLSFKKNYVSLLEIANKFIASKLLRSNIFRKCNYINFWLKNR